MSADPALTVDPRFTYRRRVAVGVDLGQSADPTSIAVVEQVKPEIPAPLRDLWRDDQRLRALEEDLRSMRTRYFLRVLAQCPLGESYILQCARIKQLLAREQIARHEPRIFVDYTGVGRAVFDIFRQERIPRLVPVTITYQGDGPNASGGLSVPKVELVSKLQAVMHTGSMEMPSDDSMPLAKVLRRELYEFRATFTGTGRARFGARDGIHDDLILAAALAVHGLTLPEVSVEPLRI